MNKRLYVGNLEYATTDKDLEELFSSEGNVVYAKVITRADGKSRGFGFVEMETEEEAQKAIDKFNQSSYKERTLFVNEARQREDNQNFSRRPEGQGYNNRRPQEDLNVKLKKLKRKFS